MVTRASSWETHPVGGWPVRVLSCRQNGHETTVRFVPSMGCNVIGFQVDGQEYLAACEPDGRILGTPVLYPTPNRVRNATFTFDDQVYRFEPNDGPHFIHGLVRHVAWELDAPQETTDGLAISANVRVAPGTDAWDVFPIRNTLSLRLEVTPGRLQMTFDINNDDPDQRLPFGLAIHPYFRILGERGDVTIHIPARRWMEAEALLPTGRLLPPSACSADPTEPITLENLDLDDVFWGMRASQPATVVYGALGTRITLEADDWFTHAVVYTPPDRPYLCVENQSCSTDAHNLAAKGFERAAHLTVLEPGASHQATVAMQVGNP